MTASTAVAQREETQRSRLPMPRELANDDIDQRKWRVLCETTFPSARTSEAILMAVDYCRARGLDIFKKPVHIVPMWNSTLGKEVETVWPGINEIQITAARTREWSGMDEPRWGPEETRTFKGHKKGKGDWEEIETAVTFPQWCAVTVYRMVGGTRCPFTEPVFWLEAYSRAGGARSELPTDMWIKRPHGQLHKVAKAAALRAAFPEEGEYTAEEMEGKEIEAGGIVVEPQSGNGKPVSAAQAKRDGHWDAFRIELAECETALKVEKLRRAYIDDQNGPYWTWPQVWKRMFGDECDKRLAEFSHGDELQQTLEDSVAAEPTTRAEYIQQCHERIATEGDATVLLTWYNGEKDARRRFSFSKVENDALKDRVLERKVELERAPELTE